MSTKPDSKMVDQFAKQHLEAGIQQSVFKNLVFENSEYWEFFTSLNGSFKEKFDAYMQEPATKKAEWLKREVEAWKDSKRIAVPEKNQKPEPMKKVDIKADPKTRRLLINALGILYEVEPEAGTNLSLMLGKVTDRNQGFCKKSSAFLDPIAPGSTVIKAIVERYGLQQFFADVFGIQKPLEPISGSSELAALTTVWVHNYKKEWAGTNPEMSDEERLKRFEEKKMRIIQKTADDIATFAGYENTEELTAELTSALPEAITLLKEHLTAP